MIGLAALAVVVAALVVAGARTPRTALGALVVCLCASAVLFAALGEALVAAAEAVLFAGGALAVFLVVRGTRVGDSVLRARRRGVGTTRAAASSLLVVAILAKAQLGAAPRAPASPKPVTAVVYAVPVALSLLVALAAIVGAPPLPRRPRRASAVSPETAGKG